MADSGATFWIDSDGKWMHDGDGHYELIVTLPSGREICFPLGPWLDRLVRRRLD
jgi:hypothetical protein